MSEQKKTPQKESGKRRGGLKLGNLFYHDTFVLCFSLCMAIIGWFIMASGNSESNSVIRNVPITVTLSGSASEDGIKVFSQSYTQADLEIAGNSLITNKLTEEDFTVTALLNPASTKLTGNTLQKATLAVRAVKNSSLSDYSIESVSPEEITVEYDRYKEAVFPVEPELKYSADTGFVTGAPVLSAEQVTVSGPESSVNKISRVAVSYTADNPLKADISFSCPLRFYDQNGQEITDLSGLYLETDLNAVDVMIPVLSKKTVDLVASTVHQPKGFSDARITVEPKQIDIAGTAEALSSITEITLDTPIDFAALDVSRNNVFTMDIPLPAGVKNISATGENAVSQATVSVNLNGYKKASLTVSADNFQVSNKPVGKEVVYNTRLLNVNLIGSEAQVSKLTGDSLAVQVDLANFADRSGVVDVPVTIVITGSGSDSCWTLGQYTVSLTLAESGSEAANGRAFVSSDALVAAPQE